MKPLIEVQPHIRAAHMYNYRGAPEEQRRRGYSYAFHLFTEGHGHMIINEQVYPVASGSLIFVRPGEGHYFVPAPGDTMDACNIYCDLWCLPQPKQPTFAYQWDDYDPRWLTEQMPCPELDGLPTSMSLRPYPHLIELIKQTLAAFNRSGKYTAQAVSACFYSWILQWHEAGSLTETADYRITRILEQMEACPEQRFSVDYWCSECGLEKSQFYRLFKQETGMSPKAYALQARMKKAAVLLMESRQSITDIALMLGYDSIHYFSNQFSSVYGISPSSYRMGKGYQKLDRWS
ncbi:AraC family transcriptional regulator [Paenibacillus thiaminolyticus]|uniref:helix-turn-helix domain-containing protein n=1 Tax=Paenibacillus thiaminolyticus TaxID=49283 RepID=UPI00232AC572|nr:AraC family transcriptional regulator [Paenibacillus thiaminolyticus]WCF09745.1 AraC family transcriptional regulator [Paenibacillus thiaminolyticus]